MTFGIDWTQTSTKRGAVLLVTFISGMFMIRTGHGDVSQLLVLMTGINGALGLAVKD